MAHYWTDFKEYAAGSGVPTGWTERWLTGATWSVEAGGIVQHYHATVSGRQLTSWGAVDSDSSRENYEILAKLRADAPTTAGRNYAGVAGSGGGAAGTEQALWARLYINNNGDYRIAYGKYVAGVNTSYQYPTIDDTSTQVWDDNSWHWIRIKVDGTNLYVKSWKDGSAEPTSWNVTWAHGVATLPDGYIGLHCFNDDSYDQWAWFSVATGGDTALSPEDVMGDFFFDF